MEFVSKKERKGKEKSWKFLFQQFSKVFVFIEKIKK